MSGFLHVDLAAAEAGKDLLSVRGDIIHRFRRFHAHFGDHFVKLAADRPVGLARLSLHLIDVAAVAHEALEKLQAIGRNAEERRKLELSDYARAARRAGELGDDEWGGTTGAGLGNKWHLGYSNVASVANILIPVNIFGIKQNIFVYSSLILF